MSVLEINVNENNFQINYEETELNGHRLFKVSPIEGLMTESFEFSVSPSNVIGVIEPRLDGEMNEIALSIRNEMVNHPLLGIPDAECGC
jgi:hypothetical protein